MDAKLTKSLTDLIDETLQELEELRKSRFAAAEIKIEGPGDGIAGKPSDGDLDAKKAEDEKDEDKEDDKDEKAEDKEKAEKAESCEKAEDKKEDKKDDKEPHKDDAEHEKKEKEMAQKLLDMHKGEMKKSLEDTESLMKSYVEERVKPLEDKLSTILDLVNKIADQPIAPKGATFRATPLLKSEDSGVETLSKAQVASKLLELKKSGTKVDSLDITRAEMGQDLNNIIRKYEIS